MEVSQNVRGRVLRKENADSRVQEGWLAGEKGGPTDHRKETPSPPPPNQHRPTSVLGPPSIRTAASGGACWLQGHPTTRASRAGHQFSSAAQSCPTLCDPMDCNTPGFPVHHQVPEFTQTHVHPAISSSIVRSPPAFHFPSIRGFSNESVLRIGWPKYWSFSRGPEPRCFLTCSQTIPNPPTSRRNTAEPPEIGIKGHLRNLQSCSFVYPPQPRVV